ncbi:MAG: lysophospholipid acyltransferase family protein [candidate division Zixibacteria bacterium]|nr:lysophospholipid acyltransferase family protein [candidate division Zixibacteria bacterium]
MKHRCEWFGLRALQAIANALPASWSAGVGGFVGRVVGRVWTRRWNIARSNLERAFPGWTRGQVESVIRGTFDNLGRTAFEIMRFGRESKESILALVDTNGDEPLAAALRLGRGAIVMSGHFGNWEMFGAWGRARGYPIDFVVKPQRNPLVDAMYNKHRRALDVGIIHTQLATRGIVQALQEKALRYSCPVVTGVLIRKPGGRFYAHFDPLIECEPTGDLEKDVFNLTQEFTRRLERHIRQYPEQWLWTHRRWRD